MWQDRAGIIEHFLAITKRVPRDRETRSNAGLGAAGYIVFFSTQSLLVSCVLRVYLLRSIMSILCSTISRPNDGLTSLSLWVDFWRRSHDDTDRYIRAGVCLRIPREHASYVDDDGHLDGTTTGERHAPSLCDCGTVFTVDLARWFGCPLRPPRYQLFRFEIILRAGDR
jgi:hypothetical protein